MTFITFINYLFLPDRRDLSCEQCTSPPPCNKVLLLVLSWLHSAINTENQMSTEPFSLSDSDRLEIQLTFVLGHCKGVGGRKYKLGCPSFFVFVNRKKLEKMCRGERAFFFVNIQGPLPSSLSFIRRSQDVHLPCFHLC